MTLIALTSDNHLDLNKVDIAELVVNQAQFLTQAHVELLLIAGDIANDFDLTTSYIKNLQAAMPEIPVRFVAGNHDMLRNVTYAQLQGVVMPEYLNHKIYDVPETNWRIIGGNGWYDYSFADNLDKKVTDFEHWKKAYWVDGQIEQSISDPERLNIELNEIEQLFKQATEKSILFLTHFIPNKKFIRYTDDNRFWNMANGMMGSTKMEKLIEKYQVKIVHFGHIHDAQTPVKVGSAWYFNQAVGVHRGKTIEWHEPSFFDAWKRRLRIINLQDYK